LSEISRYKSQLLYDENPGADLKGSLIIVIRQLFLMAADTNILKEGMDGLIRAGYYRNREALLEEAFRTLIEVKPSVKLEMAVELYKSEKVSLSRAAEIAGISMEGFKKLLELKGMKRVVSAPSEERLRKGVDFLLG
jgi:predicted HTH domain antitoxin